ncbi:MAG: hypothetical protein K2P43_10540 [Lachnospiraceae bacterium]|nr:hypothetical protein [Lachnospiraceae bacterium]
MKCENMQEIQTGFQEQTKRYRENGMVYDRFMRIHRKEFADGTFVIHQK